MTSTPHVEVIYDQQLLPETLQSALGNLRARVTLASVEEAARQLVPSAADARVIVAPDAFAHTVDARLLRFIDEFPGSTIVLSADGRKRWQTTTAADIYNGGWCDGVSAEQLTGQLAALCEARHTLAPFLEAREELLHNRGGYDDWFARFDEQLRLASQIQRDLLPDPMPPSEAFRFHAVFLPADHVSGDIYNVVRLDESTLATSIADATGHGIPAALLTLFIHRAFRGKEIAGDRYRILEPNDVLNRMNRELLETDLSHCQFVTGIHAVLNEERRSIRWSRAGLPYPVLVRRGQEPGLIRSGGILLGAVEAPPLETVEQVLSPGDRLYFYTDGLEALLCGRRAGENPFDISCSPWFASLANRDPAEAFHEINHRRFEISPAAWPRDDITVVCIECVA